MSVSTLVSAACTVTFMAATTRPSSSRSGAATERIPGASCSSVRAHPWARTSRSTASSSARSGCQRAGTPARLGSARTASSSSGARPASSTLPREVGRRREAGADAHRERDDLRDRDPGDVDDVRAVELRDRARLLGAAHERLHVRARDVPQAEGLHVGHAELQDPRRQGEGPVVGPHVAQRDERAQDAPCRRPREPGPPGHLGQRHAGPVGGEGLEDVETARDGLDEVGVVVTSRHVAPSRCSPLEVSPPGGLDAPSGTGSG